MLFYKNDVSKIWNLRTFTEGPPSYINIDRRPPGKFRFPDGSLTATTDFSTTAEEKTAYNYVHVIELNTGYYNFCGRNVSYLWIKYLKKKKIV